MKIKNFLLGEETPHEEMEILHETIHKIQKDIESFSFNTCVSSFMISVNKLKKINCNKRDILEPLIILSPFAPFICEELWNKLNPGQSVFNATFPNYNENTFLKVK